MAGSDAPLDAGTLDLLGIEGRAFSEPVERRWLREVGRAFVDLMEGRVTGDARRSAGGVRNESGCRTA